MGKGQVYTAGALSKRIARKFALSNFLTMFTLFLVFVIVLNVWATVFSYWHIDARSTYQVDVFLAEHQEAGAHSYGMSTSLLPVIFFKEVDGPYVNPHPTTDISDESIDALLTTTHSEGDSTMRVGDRFFRVHRVDGAFAIQEGDESFEATEMLLLRDITGDVTQQNELRLMSALCLLVSLAVIVPISYRMAQRSIVPINEAWKKQRRFAADASHKLKNPLAVVQANTEMIMRHPEHSVEDELAALKAISNSTEKMTAVLSALLTMAKADADGDEIVYDDVALSEILVQVCEQLDMLAEEHDIDLAVAIDAGAHIIGDAERIEELFSILIDNAINYTEAGGIIQVTCTIEKGKAIVEVRDSGIGMAPEDVNMVFQRFYRSENARSMNPGGTGLGLPIAHWIVERHNARMDVESELGIGTAIRVTFDVYGK